MNIVEVKSMTEPKVIKTQYGDKEKVNVELTEASTGNRFFCGYFIPKTGISFKVGDTIFCEISQKGKYWNLNNVQKPETLPEQAPVEISEEEKVDWDAKELRGHRRACFNSVLMQAYSKYAEGIITREQMYEDIEQIAERAVIFIYNKAPF